MRQIHTRSVLSGFLLFLPLACADNLPQRPLYIINAKEPSVAIVDSETWKVTGSIPIPKQPTDALLAPGNQFLYVLHDGMMGPIRETSRGAGLGFRPRGPSVLSVVNLESREVVKNIPLVRNVTLMSLTKDGRYLITMGVGRQSKNPKADASDLAAVHVIDTRTHEVKAVFPGGRRIVRVLWTADASRFFILSARDALRKYLTNWPVHHSLRVYGLESDKPLADIALERLPESMLLSSDEKWLYILEPGMMDPLQPWLGAPPATAGGVLRVIDVDGLKVAAAHPVGTDPRGLTIDPQTNTVVVLSPATSAIRRLYYAGRKPPRKRKEAEPQIATGKLLRIRGAELLPAVEIGTDPRFAVHCEGQAGLFVVGVDEVRLVADGPGPGPSPVRLNPNKGEKVTPGTTYLGGLPILPLCLPAQNKLALATLNQRLGLLDLPGNKLEAVLSWATPAWVNALAGMATMAAAGAIAGAAGVQPGSYQWTNLMITADRASQHAPYLGPPQSLLARPDGEFVYYLDAESGLMFPINTQNAKKTDYVRFGQGCIGARLHPDGKYISGAHNASVTILDTESNKEHMKFRLTDEELVNRIFIREQGSQILVLASKSLIVIDVPQAKATNTITGFSDPVILVEPLLTSGSRRQ